MPLIGSKTSDRDAGRASSIVARVFPFVWAVSPCGHDSPMSRAKVAPFVREAWETMEGLLYVGKRAVATPLVTKLEAVRCLSKRLQPAGLGFGRGAPVRSLLGMRIAQGRN